MKPSSTFLAVTVVVVVVAILALVYINTALYPTSANPVSSFLAAMGGRPAATTTPVVETKTVNTTTTVTHAVVVGSSNPATLPNISSFTPADAPVNTKVTIRGMNFSRVSNVITFGASRGLHHPDGTPDNTLVTEASPDGVTLTFTVPAEGSSGQVCGSNGECIGVPTTSITPGNYPVTVINSNGTSAAATFTVIN